MNIFIPIDLEKLKQYLLSEFNVEFNINDINIKNEFIEKTISDCYTYKKILKGKNKNMLKIKKITKLPDKENYKNNGRRKSDCSVSSSSECEDKNEININNNIVIDDANNIIDESVEKKEEKEIDNLNIIDNINLIEKDNKHNFDILDDKIKSDINIKKDENKIVDDNVRKCKCDIVEEVKKNYLEILYINKEITDNLSSYKQENREIMDIISGLDCLLYFLNDYINVLKEYRESKKYKVVIDKVADTVTDDVIEIFIKLRDYLYKYDFIDETYYKKLKYLDNFLN